LPVSPEDGGEHRVRYEETTGRWRKTTHPGTFGAQLVVEPAIDKQTQEFVERPMMGHATPLEYLERLILANDVFGDDIRLEKIVETPDGLSIETSQPDIDGGLPSREEIGLFMTALAFEPSRGIPSAWLRRADSVLAFDAHEANFIKTNQGDVLPIDVVLQRAGEELLAALRES
jgi:hypothetical protein